MQSVPEAGLPILVGQKYKNSFEDGLLQGGNAGIPRSPLGNVSSMSLQGGACGRVDACAVYGQTCICLCSPPPPRTLGAATSKSKGKPKVPSMKSVQIEKHLFLDLGW